MCGLLTLIVYTVVCDDDDDDDDGEVFCFYRPFSHTILDNDFSHTRHSGQWRA